MSYSVMNPGRGRTEGCCSGAGVAGADFSFVSGFALLGDAVFPLGLVPDRDPVFAFACGTDLALACSSDFTFDVDCLMFCLLTVLALPGAFVLDSDAEDDVVFFLFPDPDTDVSFVLDLDAEDDVDFFPAPDPEVEVSFILLPDPEVDVVLEVVSGLLVFFRCALMLYIVSVTDPADHSVFYLFHLMVCATNPDDCSVHNPPRKLLFQ